MMHTSIMVKIGGKQKKCKLNTQKVNSAEMGNMYKFGGKGGNFLILWKYGEYAICIFGLGGMDAPEESCPLEQENKEVGEIDHHRTWHWDWKCVKLMDSSASKSNDQFTHSHGT